LNSGWLEELAYPIDVPALTVGVISVSRSISTSRLLSSDVDSIEFLSFYFANNYLYSAIYFIPYYRFSKTDLKKTIVIA
jgi:hypothetical protein